MNCYLNDLGILCALGSGQQEVLAGLWRGDRSGLQPSDAFSPSRSHYLGAVTTPLPEIADALAVYACRNNQLLLAAAEQIRPGIEAMRERFGAERIGIALGTSTSGVRNTELALAYQAEHGRLPPTYHYKQQQMGAGADFLAEYLQIRGPAYTLSSACASSGKAFASAQRLLAMDLCDAVIVGGADSLCGLTVNGFAALESVGAGLCKPFGRRRDGINIGEAAALFILSKQPGPVCLRGVAATSDAYHFSAPDPDGTAVQTAMRAALDQAGLTPAQVDYLNLHGTATLLNDAMESKAVHAVFGTDTPVSSSKGMSGHTLGAAAALELGFCWLLLQSNDPQGRLIANINGDDIDPDLPPLNWVAPGQSLGRPLTVCQSNSFAFGGSNVSIIVAQA
ncbi:beta-ketoacyl-[acyl-carrier-protein] synthase family protein [Methylomonas sp. SURF-1]|uniref:Beta-ketoacyl-[acyl-carrier-protein] synthase family protein n=1 Tax=Methylomonas aurea TaxID=2952224 RepID=A0ABT1UJC9_9GAMM|nr:beta-ketoacyl-[acyl-carrier-protein] synthase family protein [Methylomonas sp. SURF-1]MCQ8181775.1 beta-ketoacyl-[acyl-carrier-protein] synthase family protein [Methylomonas sp. SURF-1]